MNGDRSRKQGSEMKVFKSFLRAKGAITTHNLVLEYVGNIMKIHKKQQQQQLSKILTIKTEKII